MYQKEKSQITVHKTAADMVRRDEANKKAGPLQQAIKSNRF